MNQPSKSRELLAVGVLGNKSSLGERIEMLLRRGRTFSPRASAIGVATCGVALGALMLAASLVPRWIAFAQEAATPKFDVVSIKPCDGGNAGGRNGGLIANGRLNVNCVTVMDLIKSACVTWANAHLNSPKSLRIEGGPAWIHSEAYTINAKSEVNATMPMLSGPMLQALLEDRFHLRTHRETRDIPVYVLTVAKTGPKLQPVQEGSCTPFDIEKFLAPLAPGAPHPDFCGVVLRNARKGSAVTRDFHAMTLAQFAGELPVDRPVVDKTRVSGLFDFRLEFALDETTSSSFPQYGSATASSDDSGGPSIFTALQEQLGLKLESARGPGAFLVIDHVEKPDAN
jgi:uncharacterized protein (TIGR03435 family)